MNEEKFEKLINDLIFPIFQGIKKHSVPRLASSPVKQLCTTLKNKNGLTLSIPGHFNIHYSIYRSVPFHEDEIKFMESILKFLPDLIDNDSDDDFYSSRKANVFLKAIVDYLVGGENKGCIPTILSTLEQWAQETYEGQKIASSFIVDLDAAEKLDPKFNDVKDHDFLKVISNCVDTAVFLSLYGTILHYKHLDSRLSADEFKYPYVFRELAIAASQNKIAICLNRNGEILIFKDKSLVFCKRRGMWLYFPHQTLTSNIFKKIDSSLKKRLIETALDLSFARTGGCIGVVINGRELFPLKKGGKKNKSFIVSVDDYFETVKRSQAGSKNAVKTLALKKICGQIPFSDLPRKLRMELAGIDGAFLIDTRGKIKSVGTILESTERAADISGGGRTAAACTLAKHGIGIKISNDGKISIFYKIRSRTKPKSKKQSIGTFSII